MAFNSSVLDLALYRAKYRCEACGKSWYSLQNEYGKTPLRGHSATSLHVVRSAKTGLYRATSVPIGHEKMAGRILRPNTFLVQKLGRDDDAYCLCPRCHTTVHSIATRITNMKQTTGVTKNAIPHVLENVTISFVLNSGKWMY